MVVGLRLWLRQGRIAEPLVGGRSSCCSGIPSLGFPIRSYRSSDRRGRQERCDRRSAPQQQAWRRPSDFLPLYGNLNADQIGEWFSLSFDFSLERFAFLKVHISKRYNMALIVQLPSGARAINHAVVRIGGDCCREEYEHQ